MGTLQTPISMRASGYHQQADAVLIQQCLEGDDQAWALLLERYGSLIYSITLRSELSPESVAEVFQSVCLMMLESLGTLRAEPDLSSWLTKTTLQQCFRASRQQDQQLLAVDQVGEERTIIPEKAWLPDGVIQVLEQERMIQQAISMIEEPCRRLLTAMLYERDLWFYEEVAKELSLPVSTVRSQRGPCLKKLMGVLNELGFWRSSTSRMQGQINQEEGDNL